MYWDSKMECMPKKEMEKMQYESVKKLVSHLYEFNQFYHNRMKEANVRPEDIQCLSDVSKLPFMYKQDLRDNYPTGLFTVPQKDVIRYHVSSGTTGKPTLVGYTNGMVLAPCLTLSKSITGLIVLHVSLRQRVQTKIRLCRYHTDTDCSQAVSDSTMEQRGSVPPYCRQEQEAQNVRSN